MRTAVHTITDTVGSDAICARLGVKPRSVRLARTEGRFPASWYAEISAMCDEAGVDCPLDAFNWKCTAADADQRGAA
jgi:hypothetical protein